MIAAVRFIGIAVCLLWACGGRPHAAELRLKSDARPAGAIVRLGDVAEIFAADVAEAQRLAAIELCATPSRGTRRYLSGRDVVDALFLRGEDLSRHSLSGASQVAVAIEPPPPAAPAKAPPVAAKLPPVDSRRAERMVRDALLKYLAAQGGELPWEVSFQLSTEAARVISAAQPALEVRGGASPWLGAQTFTLRCSNTQGETEVVTPVEVSLPPLAVVATRPIQRGEMIRAADVEMAHITRKGSGTLLVKVEDAIGREATRTIGPGELLSDSVLRAPIVVRRGEIVTVHARSSGLTVRMTARAKEDGGMGELVTIESLLNRETFFGRVCGIQSVEVYASAVDAR